MLTEGYFFKGVWGMASAFLDKDTRGKITLKCKNGYKEIKKLVSEDARIADFMGGASKVCLLKNPGAASKNMNLAFEESLVSNPDTSDLRRFFWEVDMSKPGNEKGVDLKELDKEKEWV